MLRSVVAVLDKSGTPIGAGCILKGTGLSQNTCYVATCAHVVFNAINSYDSHPQSINSPTIVSRTINVGWPNERPVLATIVEWWPPQPNTFSSADSLSDLCLLQIEQEYLPRAARLATDTEIIPPNTTVWAYGYSTPKGEWADASTAIAKDAMGWLQLNPLGIRSVTVRQGFSGTPVWDEQKKFVYGLVAEGTTNGKVEYSRAIPVEILLRAFPNIREIDCNLDNCVGLLDDGIPSLPDYYVDRPMPFEEVRQKLLRPKYAGAKAILGITSADSGDFTHFAA